MPKPKDYYLISKVRKYFLKDTNLTLEEIANHFNISESQVSVYLTNEDNLNIVKSLNEANLYFLFNNLTERKIHTENDGITIINNYDFNANEKIFIQSFGLKFC